MIPSVKIQGSTKRFPEVAASSFDVTLCALPPVCGAPLHAAMHDLDRPAIARICCLRIS